MPLTVATYRSNVPLLCSKHVAALVSVNDE